MPTKNEPIDLSTGTLYIKDQAGDLVPLAIDLAAETCAPVFDVIARIVGMVRDIAKWGVENRPKLVHLTRYAKTARRRKKNARRLMQEYIREVYRCG